MGSRSFLAKTHQACIFVSSVFLDVKRIRPQCEVDLGTLWSALDMIDPLNSSTRKSAGPAYSTLPVTTHDRADRTRLMRVD